MLYGIVYSRVDHVVILHWNLSIHAVIILLHYQTHAPGTAQHTCGLIKGASSFQGYIVLYNNLHDWDKINHTQS